MIADNLTPCIILVYFILSIYLVYIGWEDIMESIEDVPKQYKSFYRDSIVLVMLIISPIICFTDWILDLKICIVLFKLRKYDLKFPKDYYIQVINVTNCYFALIILIIAKFCESI